MALFVGLLAVGFHASSGIASHPKPKWAMHHEDEENSMPPSLYPNVANRSHLASYPQPRTLGPYIARQVNVDANGMNIVGDAANEPSICVDPTNPAHIAIAWRQFDSISSNFRQAGHAYSWDGGSHWVNNGPLTPGTFRSDPILSASPVGEFYYDSLLTVTDNDMWNSQNWGKDWNGGNYCWGGDKAWQVCDTGANSPGRGIIYTCWSDFSSSDGNHTFNRSFDGGRTFETPSIVPQMPTFGTLALGSGGDLYIAGTRPNNVGLCWAHSTQPWVGPAAAVFPTSGVISSTYDIGPSDVINPDGLPGQVWIAEAPAGTAYAGHVYVVASVGNFGGNPDSVVMFRSTNGGSTWSSPIPIYSNLGTSTHAFHWFGTMSVAPNGRIDVVYNDTGLDPNQTTPTTCVTMYRFSNDDGNTWSTPQQLTQPWAFGVGYPQQNKIGDYYHMISDNTGAHLAFAATFNGEEDIYYMRLGAQVVLLPPNPQPGPPTSPVSPIHVGH